MNDAMIASHAAFELAAAAFFTSSSDMNLSRILLSSTRSGFLTQPRRTSAATCIR